MKTKNNVNMRVGITITIVVILFILLGHFYPAQIQSALKRPLFKLPETTVDWWSVSHFLFFGLLAFLYPSHIGELFVISVLWEVIEDGLAPTNSKQLIDCTKKYDNSWQETFKVMWCDHAAREKDYWYGKWDDIFFNSMGIILGYAVRKMVSKQF